MNASIWKASVVTTAVLVVNTINVHHATAALDINQPNANADLGFNDLPDSRDRIGQSFVPSLPQITQFVVQLQSAGDTTSNTVYTLELFATTNNPGDASADHLPTGAPLATATLVGSSATYGSGLDDAFNFTTPVPVTPGNRYVAVLSIGDPRPEFVWKTLAITNANLYGGGHLVNRFNGIWGYADNDNANYDFQFQVHGEAAVPEPMSLGLMSIAGLIMRHRRR